MIFRGFFSSLPTHGAPLLDPPPPRPPDQAAQTENARAARSALRADAVGQGAVPFPPLAPEISLRLLQDRKCSAVLLRLVSIPCSYFSCRVGGFSDIFSNFVSYHILHLTM